MSTTANLNSVLSDITIGLQMLNAAAPEIATIIKLFTGTKQSIQQLLDDADATENADIENIKKELGS